MAAPLNVNLKRQYSEPLDASSIFTSLTEAQTYAASDPYKYYGQVIGVVETVEDNTTVTVYKIDSDNTLKSLETAPVDEEAVIIDSTGKITLKGKDTATSGQVFGKKSDGTYGFITVDTSGIQTEIGELSDQVEANQTNISTLQSSVGEITSDISEINTTISGIEEDITEITGNISTVEGEVDTIAGNYLNDMSISINTDNKIEILKVGGENLDKKILDFIIQKAITNYTSDDFDLSITKDGAVTASIKNSPKLGGVDAADYALASTLTALDTALTNFKNKNVTASGNIVGLNASGKIDNEYISSLFVTDSFSCTTLDDMLSQSTAEKGDIAIVEDARTNDEKSTKDAYSATFILKGETYSDLSNWARLEFPCLVTTVNGKAGVIVLTGEDIKVDSSVGALTLKAAIEAKQDSIVSTSPLYNLISKNKSTYNKNKVLVTDANGDFAESTISSSELGMLSGMDENIKTALAQKEVASNKKTEINGTTADLNNVNYPSVKAVKDYVDSSVSSSTTNHTHNGTDSPKISYANLENAPTNVSAFTNDANYQTKTQVTTAIGNLETELAADITEVQTNLDAKFNTTTGHTHNGTDSPKINYTDINGTPTNVSVFTNDANYQTGTQVTTAINTHNTNSDAHTTLFAAKQDKIIQVSNVSCTNTAWVDNTETSGYYELTLSNQNITNTSRVDVTPHIDGIDTIIAAGVLPVTESENGTVKLYAKSQPTTTFTVDLLITPSISNQ